MSPLFGFNFFGLGPSEILLLGGLLFLLFGARKLPDIGRSLGKGLVEFKKGIKGIEDDVDSSQPVPRSEPAAELPRPPQRIATPGPKFADQPAEGERKV